MLTLHSLKSKGTTKPGKRLGRGDSSGAGSYSGKGRKGQRARSGTSGFTQRQKIMMRPLGSICPTAGILIRVPSLSAVISAGTWRTLSMEILITMRAICTLFMDSWNTISPGRQGRT